MSRPYTLLREHARDFGDTKPAAVFARRTLTYPQLVALSDRHAAVLAAAGIARGTRTIVMVPVGPDLIALLFALFKLGAVPVVVDPGMGMRRMLHCFRAVGPEAFAGVPVAHLVRVLRPGTFRGLRSVVTLGRRWFWGGHSIGAGPVADSPVAGSPVAGSPVAGSPVVDSPATGGLVADTPDSGSPVTGSLVAGTPDEVAVEDADPLLIAFTTGYTGPAKGAEFTYELLAATLAQAGDGRFGHDRADVCLATSLSFGLTHLMAGATTVFPDIDYGRIARADPARIAADIERHGATVLFGSPALLDPLARHIGPADRRLRTLRRVIAGGAPTTAETLAALRDKLAAFGTGVTVAYGATEVVPITAIEADEILDETGPRTAAGAGTCVGRPVAGIGLRVVRATDGPLPDWSLAEPLADGEVGEIVVSGPAVSRHYAAPAGADHATKIIDGDRVWHRTGDLGRIDDAGRVWLAGRRQDTVHTAAGPRYTVQCEGVFDTHPEVYRSALVGTGPRDDRRPVVCVELRPGVPAADRPRIARELAELADNNDVTRGLHDFLFHPGFPVDPRHNAKINHGALASWAAGR